MTRLAILADIHGNLPALEAVLADMGQFHVNGVIVAGDVINWGPFSPAVVARVTASGWPVIRGNNEYYLLDYRTPRQPAHWAEFEIVPWLHRQMGHYWQNIIAAWPDALSLRYPDAPLLYVCHGSPRRNTEPIFPTTPDHEIAEMFSGIAENTIISAHTHLAMDRHVDRWHLLNPGSVGTPIDGLPGASYMLLDSVDNGWQATLRRIDYDDTPVFEEFERLHILEEGGVTAHLLLEEYRHQRLFVAPFNLWRAAECPDAPLSMKLLDEFTDEVRWQYTPAPYCINMTPAESAALAAHKAVPC